MNKDISILIDTVAIKHNINYLKQKSKTDLMLVLKGNAYGHGIIQMAKIVRSYGIIYIGVATITDAILLRENGDKGRILAWIYNINSSEFRQALSLDIDIAIFDETIIPKFIKLIPKGKKIKITMFIDTGINRAGISYDKAYDACIQINKYNNIEFVGLMSHLICSELKNNTIINDQLQKFRTLRKKLADINIVPPLVHIANTGAVLNYNVSDFTLSRVGRGLYGIVGSKIHKNLKLLMTVNTVIIQLKYINKDEYIGYDLMYKTKKRMRIAILPIGFHLVIPREASQKLNIYINNTKRKVLGMINMDQIMVEATDEDKLNDKNVIIFGNGYNCPQTIYDISKLSSNIPTEFLSRINSNIIRTYIK
jgi:alanine racemase